MVAEQLLAQEQMAVVTAQTQAQLAQAQQAAAAAAAALIQVHRVQADQELSM